MTSGKSFSLNMPQSTAEASAASASEHHIVIRIERAKKKSKNG